LLAGSEDDLAAVDSQRDLESPGRCRDVSKCRPTGL